MLKPIRASSAASAPNLEPKLPRPHAGQERRPSQPQQGPSLPGRRSRSALGEAACSLRRSSGSPASCLRRGQGGLRTGSRREPGGPCPWPWLRAAWMLLPRSHERDRRVPQSRSSLEQGLEGLTAPQCGGHSTPAICPAGVGEGLASGQPSATCPLHVLVIFPGSCSLSSLRYHVFPAAWCILLRRMARQCAPIAPKRGKTNSLSPGDAQEHGELEPRAPDPHRQDAPFSMNSVMI